MISTVCIKDIKEQPICSPDENSTWYSGSTNLVTWYIYNSIYLDYGRLNLYFYYEKDFNYYQIINFTNIGTNRGFYPVKIDNSWFPINCTENDIKWKYTLLLLGNTTNPNYVLNDTLSEWKRVNFNIIQNSSISCLNNNSSINSGNLSSDSKFDKWKIIVIVIVIILIIVTLSILFYIRKKLLILFKNKNKKINKKHIYIKDVYYQKPNEADCNLNLHKN